MKWNNLDHLCWQYRKVINPKDDAGNKLDVPRVAIEISNGMSTMVIEEWIIRRLVELLDHPKKPAFKGQKHTLIESFGWKYVPFYKGDK